MERGLGVCNSCGSSAETFDPGPDGRPEAACPSCGCLERDRFLIQLLHGLVPRVLGDGSIVEIAPARPITRALSGYGPVVRVDLNPKARRVDVAADLTKLPFPDGCADVLVCYHVLEHVVDDLAAMREIARVLSGSGVAFVEVPMRRGLPTDEDPDASPEERTRRFGLADHVRWYGDDFDDRLAAAGLRARIVRTDEIAGPRLFDMLRLMRGEEVWLCTRMDSPETPALDLSDNAWWADALPHLVVAVATKSLRLDRRVRRLMQKVERLEAGMRRLREANGRLKSRRDDWKRRYHALRSRRAVRLALRLSGGRSRA